MSVCVKVREYAVSVFVRGSAPGEISLNELVGRVRCVARRRASSAKYDGCTQCEGGWLPAMIAHPLAHRTTVVRQVYEVLLLCTPECQYDIALLYRTTVNSVLRRVCASLAMVRPFARLKPNIPVLPVL